MNSNDSLPGCIGYYGQPAAPNNCQGCSYADMCEKVIAKKRLQKLLADVQEAKAIARGEK